MPVEKEPPRIDPRGLNVGDIVVPEPHILERTAEVAAQIAEKYRGKELLIVGILEGAVQAVTDLTRALHRADYHDFKTTWIRVGSYGTGNESNRSPKLLQELYVDPKGKGVLIVDEVSETGHTLETAENKIKEMGATSVATCITVQKIGTRLIGNPATYTMFYVEGDNVWLQGRGMDSDGGVGREDPDIRVGPYYYGKESSGLPQLQ